MAGFHPVEIWVADLAQARDEWGWLLRELGFERESRWPEGESWGRRGVSDGHDVAESDRDDT